MAALICWLFGHPARPIRRFGLVANGALLEGVSYDVCRRCETKLIEWRH